MDNLPVDFQDKTIRQTLHKGNGGLPWRMWLQYKPIPQTIRTDAQGLNENRITAPKRRQNFGVPANIRKRKRGARLLHARMSLLNQNS